MTLGRLRNLKYKVFPALSTLGFLGSLSFASVPQWDSHEQVQKFHTDHLKDDKTAKHIVDQNHEIRVSPEQLETLSKYIQSLGKVETTSLTEIPKYIKDGLKIKSTLLLMDLEDLQSLILLPEEKGKTITLADADLMKHLTGLLKDNYTLEKSSYKSFCSLIQQFSDRLDKSFNKIFEAKISFSVVADDASSFYVDIPLSDFLAEDHTLAANDKKVMWLGEQVNDLQCCLFPADDWYEKRILTTDTPLFLRVYFSTADGFPCVAKTGMIQLDPASIPQSSQTLGDVLKVAVGKNNALVDLPTIQEDIRDSIINHLLLQFCLSSQKVLKTNKRLSPELKEQISWSSLCSQFLINITRRESAMFEQLVAADSDLCNGPIPEEFLKALKGQRELPSSGGKKQLTRTPKDDTSIILDNVGATLNVPKRNLAPNEPNGEIIDHTTQTFKFFQPGRSAFTVPGQATPELTQKYPYFLLRFGLKSNNGSGLHPRLHFSFYQGKPGESDTAQLIGNTYSEDGDRGVDLITAVSDRYSRVLLGKRIKELLCQMLDLKDQQQQRLQEYFDLLIIMAESANHNARSVQSYILSTQSVAAKATTTEVSPTDRLQVQQIGQNMKGDLEKKVDDERVDVTSFILPTGVDLVQFLTEQNKFVKSDVVNECSFVKRDADKKYHEVKRRVLIVTLEKPIDIHWMRRNMTMDGQKFYSDALCQTSQVRSITDTGADDPTHPEITTIYPEPPRGARLSFTPLK